MKGGYFIAKGNRCFTEICQMLEMNLNRHFRAEIIDGFIYFTENFSFANSSELMTVIRVQKINSNDNECEVEVISGGGATGLFSMSWGNENRRVNKALKLITEFCLSRQFEYSKIAYKE